MTPLQMYLQSKLRGTTLDAFVAERRTAGDSWDSIAAALSAKAGNATVNGDSVRRWYAQNEVEPS